MSPEMSDEGITFYLDEGGNEADREVVILVDSNDAFPEVATMAEPEVVEPLLPEPEEEPTTSWFELRLVAGPKDAGLGGISLSVRTPDGATRSATANAGGVLRLDAMRGQKPTRPPSRNSAPAPGPSNGPRRNSRTEPRCRALLVAARAARPQSWNAYSL